MNKPKIMICLCMILAILATAQLPNVKATASTKTSEFVPGEVIVGSEEISANTIAVLNAMGGSVIKEIPMFKALLVRVTVGSEYEYIQKARNLPGIKYAERNGIVHAAYIPNDPYWSELWNMRIIKADKAWDIHKGNTSTVIAIVDTGVDYNHEDLSAHYITGGYDWVNDDNDPIDDHYHGTHCAGIAAAVMDNYVGVVGVAQCSIWAEKVLDSTGHGSWDDLAYAIWHATNGGADVISMSLGGYSYSSLVDSACTYAWDHGALLVAAAGNDDLDIDLNPHYPASYNTVIAVSATTSTDEKASYSNYGNKIEVVAPGSGIFSTLPGNEYSYLSGTSMACPHVAGLAALLWSYKPSLTNAQLRDSLHSAVDDLGTPGKDIYFGYGRINAYKALVPSPPQMWQYHFRISPFPDQVWLNTTPQAGGTLLYGFVNLTYTHECYPAPVLGWATGNSFYMAIDFKTSPSCYELGFIVGTISTASGKFYGTQNGTSWTGPTSVTLVPISQSTSEGSSRTCDAIEEVNPQAWRYHFTLSPIGDHVWLNTASQTGGTLLYGYANLTYADPCYPAPILGWATGNSFYMAIDYKTSASCYELGFIVGTISTASGKLYRTQNGMSWVGPTSVTLVPASQSAVKGSKPSTVYLG